MLRVIVTADNQHAAETVMAEQNSSQWRRALWRVHQWIGAGFLLLLIPIALSGALLTYDHAIDRLLNPQRYAVSGTDVSLSPSRYMSIAAEALPQGARPASVSFGNGPVVVSARGAAEGGMLFRNVYLDPPTGNVLDVVDPRRSLVGFMHRFHENLTVPEYSGRAVVGWIGVGVLFLCVTGLFIWWPRAGGLMRALRWRRMPETSGNLHHLFGFWIALPLAAVSFTGIYLAFPPQARTVMSALAPTSPQGGRPGFGLPAAKTVLTVDDALRIAREAQPAAQPLAVFVPAGARNQDATSPPPAWRVQLKTVEGAVVTALIDDRSGTLRQAEAVLIGDRTAQWIRFIHEGSHSGPVWAFIVLLTGLFPAVLGVTGAIMWWRGWRRRHALRAGPPVSGLQAAE
jgi:uncharacterized iron-regulated membrane protein